MIKESNKNTLIKTFKNTYKKTSHKRYSNRYQLDPKVPEIEKRHHAWLIKALMSHSMFNPKGE